MSASKEKVGAKQEAAILALLSSRNIEEAARVAGVNQRTLFRWMKDPAFIAAYRAARRAAFAQTVARLQYASSAAASVLLKVLADPATPTSTKVRAAESVIAHAVKAMEVDDIEARVTELERAAEENKSGGRK